MIEPYDEYMDDIACQVSSILYELNNTIDHDAQAIANKWNTDKSKVKTLIVKSITSKLKCKGD